MASLFSLNSKSKGWSVVSPQALGSRARKKISGDTEINVSKHSNERRQNMNFWENRTLHEMWAKKPISKHLEKSWRLNLKKKALSLPINPLSNT